MKPHQMFAALSPELATQILEDLFALQKELYKTAVAAAAQSLKVRPVFLERQPRTDRNKRLIVALGHADMGVITGNVIGGWLLKNQTAMLADFLDSLQIKHDKGIVEDLPKTVEDAALHAAIDGLLAKYPQEIATLYLQAFHEMNDARWPNLALLLRDDIRLQLPVMK